MSFHLAADLDANTERFIERVRPNKVVWGLKSDNGWAYCPSNEYECDVLLFWSDQAYAKRHVTDIWSEYQPTQIDLESFIDNWLFGMHKDGLLAGLNFNADLAGLEICPKELAQRLV